MTQKRSLLSLETGKVTVIDEIGESLRVIPLDAVFVIKEDKVQ